MKRTFVILLLLVLSISLLAEIFPQKTEKYTADRSVKARSVTRSVTRDVPDWEWEVPPQSLLTNYADYFQAYGALPIALQPDEHGSGIYIVYRVKDQAGNSEVSYSYIDAEGNVLASQGMGEVGYYCDAEVDQQTGDVFATWHAAIPGTPETLDCLVTYDLYHIMLSHGLWKDPVITVIDSSDPPIPDPTENDEFIWPELAIGPSPTAGKQRLYMIASNNIAADGAVGFPSENPIICWADFDQNDLDLQSDLDWNYRTIATFDSWNAEDPMWYRGFKAWTVIDNKVIFAGYRLSNEDYDPDEMFCFVNENYGEGEFVEYYQELQIPEDNPSWEYNGFTWCMYSDLTTYPDGPPSEPYPDVYQSFIDSGRFNLYPSQDGNSVTWGGALGILFDIDPAQLNMYRPLWYQIYPKIFRFDLTTNEFSFTDVYPSGANPNDGIPMKPWDLDEDGEYDEVWDDNMPKWAEDWPIFHYDEDSAFYYNHYYVTSNPDYGWMVYIWVDGLNAKEANEGTAGFENWVATPEIAICASNNWGMTWSDPIFMNANPESENYQEELDGMIPCFVYPGDVIEDAGDNMGILHLFFLDDNDFGSFHSQQQGLNNGSTFEYAAIRIDFNLNAAPDNELVQAPSMTRNYPNPFNPQTTIEFELKNPGNMKIDIYNVKGQKVETLTNEFYDQGKHTLIWNADNLPSGMYFYKADNEGYVTTNRMILLK
ncbi:MAG: T9SS type A sorting domain-containing protein [Candidatus Cloacimonetes bacterium]|nr:T9SS type A sorting domain-containing protein [Candidatus Cloacimonadota bacterium]